MLWLSYRRKSDGGKRLGAYTVNHKFQIYLSKAEIDYIFRGKLWRKLFFKNFCVISSNSKDNHGAYVSKDCRPDFFFHLLYILMSHSQIEFVFSGLRENISKRFIGKRLEFINKKIKIWKRMENAVGHISPRKSG